MYCVPLLFDVGYARLWASSEAYVVTFLSSPPIDLPRTFKKVFWERYLISTFDLTLLGSFVSAGGILFLCRGKRPQFGSGWRTVERSIILSEESREQRERATLLEAARWLTVGALTLFVGFLHGAEEGYLFGPWSDVMFHVVFVSTCWTTAALRINKRTAAVRLPVSSAPHVRN